MRMHGRFARQDDPLGIRRHEESIGQQRHEDIEDQPLEVALDQQNHGGEVALLSAVPVIIEAAGRPGL
jgi:hypothetical protein